MLKKKVTLSTLRKYATKWWYYNQIRAHRPKGEEGEWKSEIPTNKRETHNEEQRRHIDDRNQEKLHEATEEQKFTARK